MSKDSSGLDELVSLADELAGQPEIVLYKIMDEVLDYEDGFEKIELLCKSNNEIERKVCLVAPTKDQQDFWKEQIERRWIDAVAAYSIYRDFAANPVAINKATQKPGKRNGWFFVYKYFDSLRTKDSKTRMDNADPRLLVITFGDISDVSSFLQYCRRRRAAAKTIVLQLSRVDVMNRDELEAKLNAFISLLNQTKTEDVFPSTVKELVVFLNQGPENPQSISASTTENETDDARILSAWLMYYMLVQFPIESCVVHSHFSAKWANMNYYSLDQGENDRLKSVKFVLSNEVDDGRASYGARAPAVDFFNRFFPAIETFDLQETNLTWSNISWNRYRMENLRNLLFQQSETVRPCLDANNWSLAGAFGFFSEKDGPVKLHGTFSWLPSILDILRSRESKDYLSVQEISCFLRGNQRNKTGSKFLDTFSKTFAQATDVQLINVQNFTAVTCNQSVFRNFINEKYSPSAMRLKDCTNVPADVFEWARKNKRLRSLHIQESLFGPEHVEEARLQLLFLLTAGGHVVDITVPKSMSSAAVLDAVRKREDGFVYDDEKQDWFDRVQSALKTNTTLKSFFMC